VDGQQVSRCCCLQGPDFVNGGSRSYPTLSYLGEQVLAKNPTGIMEIFATYDLTRCAWSAAQLVGCDPKTVQRYVDLRDARFDPFQRMRRARLIDPYLKKVEELVEDSHGTDVVHDRLRAMGFGGNQRTTRRAVAAIKVAYRAGRRRGYWPWLPEPGKWLQYVWADGPRVGERQTQLFCAWLAWSRYRVVLPTWDRKLGTLLACLDATLRRLGGGPTYLLTDNERTVTADRVAGVPVRHPVLVAAARHLGLEVRTCVAADPESKGGSEATVRLAKGDLVPPEANLLQEYQSFGELAEACERFSAQVNGRAHRESGRVPTAALEEEREHLHVCCPGSRTRRRWARPGPSRPTRPSATAQCATRRLRAGWASISAARS
jgi:transposase